MYADPFIICVCHTTFIKKKLGVGIVWFLLHYFKKSTFLASNFHQFQFYPLEQIETRLTGESNYSSDDPNERTQMVR